MAARLLALGTLVLVVAACGAESIPGDTPKAPEYDAVRFEIVVESPYPEGGLPFRSSGSIDMTRGSSETRGEDFHEVVIGQVSYEELQPHIDVPPGTRWCSYDGAASESDFLETIEKPGINLIHFYGGSQPESPADYFDFLRDVSHTEPKRVGVEDVRGVPTIHYSAVIDNRRFWSHTLEEAGWRVSSIERYLQNVSAGQGRVEAWIDADGYARRVVSDEELWASWHATTSPDAEPLDVEPTVVTTEYFDFGVNVDIEPPTDSEVIACAELPVREG